MRVRAYVCVYARVRAGVVCEVYNIDVYTIIIFEVLSIHFC